MKIDQLRKSISELPKQEALNLILERRETRRTPPVETRPAKQRRVAREKTSTKRVSDKKRKQLLAIQQQLIMLEKKIKETKL